MIRVKNSILATSKSKNDLKAISKIDEKMEGYSNAKHLYVADGHDARNFKRMLEGKLLIIEGIIGAGKSTLSSDIFNLCKQAGIKVIHFEEPIIRDLFDLFLSDQKKYAFAFQLAMLCKRQIIYKDADRLCKDGYFCIIDRSLHGDFAFATMHKERNNISDHEWKAYLDCLKSETLREPDFVAYLNVNPGKAIERTIRRDRSGEDSYDIKYFRDLEAVYKKIIPLIPAGILIDHDWSIDRSRKPSIQRAREILSLLRKEYVKPSNER